ncbi:dipeptidase [Mucilaginibacter sp. SP1R1]|uniref:dipeptidase n=1 Tax=Mucilaginibacter sp. SP1R1 TaxID=2723091 RepID=UPI0016155891|nr:membrane dipeptidase [Mucilaginibacter sp. SP1R1]MBB6148035.1 microsomal dipeptidase-like Zn-dependent dipeptidase [Mucilaginibacter sp. SP1R1]
MKNAQTAWSRRKFLTTTAIAGGTTLVLNSLGAWAFDDTDPRVAKIVAGTLGVDTHNHIDVPLTTRDVPGPDINLADAMEKSGLSAICMTFAVDYQKLDTPGLAYERFLNGLSSMDQQLKNSNMKRSFKVSDLRDAHQKHRPTVIQAVEGAHFLEGHLDRLQLAYDRGLRLITLLHDSDASVPLGDVFTNPVRWGGLTAFGAEVIRECERLGIVVDLSHANEATVTAALKVATRPVLISHTGLNTQLGQNERMGKMFLPRLISKEYARFVAGNGGVIGVWTHLADSALEYARNIRAMVDVVGIDHVCIGTDTKLTHSNDRPGGPRPDQGIKPGENKPQGTGDGKRPDRPPGDGQNQAFRGEGSNKNWPEQKSGFYYTVVEAMLKVGFNADEIGKVGGGNFCRVFDAATKGHP